jgi:putative tricarboxylic transport membrane protein
MRKRDRVALYCFIAFSIFILEESWRLGLGGLHQPGPGFLPFGCAAIIAIFAIIRLIIGRGKKVGSTGPFFKRERVFKFLVVVAICFGYGLLLSYIGFVLCTGIFVLISLKTIEPKTWGKAIFISVATAFATWLLFDYWLQIQAPKGTWVYPIYEKIGGILWK